MIARGRSWIVLAATVVCGLALTVASYVGAPGVALALGLLLAILLAVVFLTVAGADQRTAEGTEALKREVDARERLAEAEQDSAERFRAVIDSAHDAIIAIDSRGTVDTFNKAAERIFGYSPEEVVGRNVKILMAPPHRDAHDGYLHNYMTTGVAKIIGTGREVEARRKDGTIFPIDLSVGEMRIGDHRGFIGVIRDISERRQAERRVQELTAELVHVSRLTAMGQLASSLAHELNQPLTAVMNYAEAARGLVTANPARAAELVAKASGQAERAGDIIRRLRGFVEKRKVERSAEDLGKVVEEAVALAAIGAKVDGIQVVVELAAGAPPVSIDKVQIQQVLVNLIRNAIEVLRQAERRVLTIRSMVADDGVQEVAIIDTGPGIAPEIAGQIFQPFVSTKKGGMGVGLSISRSIVEAHGGRLWTEPNPEGGTVFRFVLPATREQKDG